MKKVNHRKIAKRIVAAQPALDYEKIKFDCFTIKYTTEVHVWR